MKRKIIIILTMITLVATSLFAYPQYLANQVSSVKIYGFIKEYTILYITPIEISENSAIGMPFDIMDSSVRYNAPASETLPVTGREIASWSFATNTPSPTLTIKAFPLVNEQDSSTSVNYYMVFKYSYVGEDAGANATTVTGYLTVPSDGNEQTYSAELSNIAEYTSNALPVISMDDDVRIMLYNYDETTRNNWPAGFYFSTVNITLTGV